MKIILFILFCTLKITVQRSTPESDSYVAAVVEYHVNANYTANVQNYVSLIEEAANQDADIVVFPEMTLNSGMRTVHVPFMGLLQEYPVPADQPLLYDEILVALSEAAKTHQIYVVVNLQEIMNCEDAPREYCPEIRTYLFNTNVVFDRDGAVIDRYRKINLFGEFTRTPALQPDLGKFTTDFGVTFGHFICFDLMFQVPAVQTVEKLNLTDVVFTTMWFSELPYLTAVQIQEAYAYAMNVNFLASGANNVRVGSAGSGIFSGKAGSLISVMPGVDTTRLLVARVPKIPGQVTGTYPGHIHGEPTELDNLVLLSDPSLPSHVSRLLQPGYQEFTLVDKEVSCQFRVRLNQTEGEEGPVYRAFIHDGTNTYSRRDVGVASCTILACKNENLVSCPYRFNNKQGNVEIEELEIEMTSYRAHYNNSLHCDDIVYYPSSFTITKFPLNPVNYTFIDVRQNGENILQNGGRERVIYKLNAPQNNLVSFNIWGRVYYKDVNKNKAVTLEDIQKYNDIEDIIYGIKD